MLQFDRPDYLKLNPDQVLSKPVAEMSEVISAARKNARFNDQSQSSAVILKDIWEPVVDEINDLMGTSFYSPTDHLNVGIFGVSATPGHAENRYRYDADKLLTFIADNKARLPDNIANLTLESIQVDAQNRARQARADYEDVAQRSFGFNAGMGAFLGGAAGVIEDPIIASSGLIGTGAKSIWKLAVGEALIGAGVEAVAQTGVREWYKTLGYDYTYQDFLRNVGYGAAGGAVLPVALRGGREAVRLTTDQAKKGIEALRGSNLTNEQSEILSDMAEALEEIEADNPFVLTPEMRTEAEVEHSARLEEGRTAVDVNRAPAISDEPTLHPSIEAIEAATDNLDNIVFKIPAKNILVDAKRFQFKSGGDEFGVSEKLQGITEWNPDYAGTVMVWEDIDGKIFIADGHQRVGLAKRIMAQDPSQEITLIARKLREVDGISAEEAMVRAAGANIANADTKVHKELLIDAAKVLRIAPDRIDELKLPPRSELVRQARDLVRLSDEAFGSIVNEIIPGNQGAIVGRLIEDQALQLAAIKVLAKSSPDNLFQAEAIVRQVREADAEQVTQISLFGEETVMESYFTERAKILNQAYKELSQDKKAFESLTRNADRLEAEGNKLARNQNQRRAEQDGQAIALLQTLANRKGTLSDELTAAARSARDTGNFAAATRNFVDAVGRAIQSGDFAREATGDVGRAFDVAPQSRSRAVEDEPVLDGFDEPTGVAAREQADQMSRDMFRDLEEEPQVIDEAVSPIEEDRVALEEIRMPLDDDLPPDQLRAQVKALTDENVPIVKDLIARIDAKFGTKSGDNIKDLSKVTQKANRPSILAKKPWHKVSHIRDSYRFKTVIDDIRDVPAIFDELLESGISLVKVDTGKLFEPKEWGWRIIAFDLRMPNGQLVEWYLPIKELEAQKKAEGHLIFEEWRNKTPEELEAQHTEWLAAIDRSYEGYDDAFQSALDRLGISREEAAASWSKAESSMLEAARKSPSSSGITTSADVRGLETQVPSSVRMALEPSLQKSMARDVPSSTRANLGTGIEDTPRDLITDITEDIKPEDYDLEIPVDYDNEGNAITRTLRDIKSDVDAEDALVSRLEFCGL